MELQSFLGKRKRNGGAPPGAAGRPAIGQALSGLARGVFGPRAGEYAPYLSSSEHLWDELRRIDLLVRAQTVRWRMTVGASKPENLWGMVHVTDAEVDAYLASDYISPAELPVEIDAALAELWEAARLARRAIDARIAATHECELRLASLQDCCGLSDLQCDLLLVGLLPELDSRYRRLFGYLQDDASRTQPVVELALQILEPAWLDEAAALAEAGYAYPESGAQAVRLALDPGGALLANALVVLGGEARGDEALPMRSLRLDDRITAFLLGDDAPDARLAGILAPLAGPLAWEALAAPDAQRAQLQALARSLRTLAEVGAGENDSPLAAPPVFLFHGPYGGGRLKAARAMCAAAGLPLLEASAPAALRASIAWDQVLRLAYREARLQGAALFWSGAEALLERAADPNKGGEAWRWEALLAAAEAYPGATFLSSELAWDPPGRFHTRPFISLEFTVPYFNLRAKLWERYLPPEGELAAPLDRSLLARELANDFQFTEGQVLDALATARAVAARRAPLHPRLTALDLYEGCRRQASRLLVNYARRIEPRSELTFDDLILPLANKRQLEELSQRVALRSRVYSDLGFERRLSLGKGLVALFTGGSGTGKTMAAELLARQRGVDLYKVDLSAVTSKWVGETEKNLARVFAEAEDANAIIFFDEADALFGKRGEVKEAQDRWANMEVNYLLQRVEEYAGVVILATNLRQNIDEAFLRRIQWMVEFPFPDAEARFRIYRRLFPESVRPPDDAGLRLMAKRFRLAGGSIKNVVVDATFRSLAAYDPAGGQAPRIRVRHLILAAAREYQKLGLPVSKGEFGEGYYRYVERTILAPRPE